MKNISVVDACKYFESKYFWKINKPFLHIAIILYNIQIYSVVQMWVEKFIGHC